MKQDKQIFSNFLMQKWIHGLVTFTPWKYFQFHKLKEPK